MPKGIYPLASYTVTGTSNPQITINNIPQTYTDLKLVMSYKRGDTGPSGDHYVEFNGGGGSIYSWVYMQASGGLWTARSNGSALLVGQFTGTSNDTFVTFELHIPNYTTNNFKPITVEEHREDNSTSANNIFHTAGLYRSNAPITSIMCGYGFAQNAKIDLYGIAR